MSTRHTPGPWSYSGSHEIWSEEFQTNTPIAKVFQRIQKEGREANTNLIAAAPDLLAVLLELKESASYWSEYDVPLGIVERIHAAIVKATGDAP